MIISSSSIGMESARTYTSLRMDANALNTSGGVNSFLSMLKNKGNSINDQKEQKPKEETEKSAADSLSDTLEDIRNRYDALKTKSLGSTSKLERDAISRIRTQCLQFLLQLLFGRRSSMDDVGCDIDLSGTSTSSGEGGITTVTQNFCNFHYYEETEETTFSTEGKVITASGEEFDFNLSLTMSRSFAEYYENNYEMTYSLCDPLVINLSTDIASVSDQKFKFDLDGDGQLDEISRLSSGSGYLALDKNGDGIINDGTELFGTKSGNGFQDLAKYDLDGNGWIDEADEIYKSLKIYIQNEDGTDTLVSLSQRNVGAIYLDSVSTEFSDNNIDTNVTNAVIRRTGLFLYENGTAGTIQHVDLAKAEYSA